ncbi:relaxase/mobilization nuclease domain-containing protein [Acinetobacter sp. ANC 5600]|uniref:relaxase/mobilization nuclease domain-containing protein n=1 Tax=Acinetobacter sp. ANC 5600 TaxID=1960940 RepID=UPI0009930BAC|nr:relaxase/mobilization nuclease domain-containing protein [Acinetobacter sp. ANC 5600]OOV79449.1 DNA primase [Acinetobacter sp. ANC 5600]
MIIKVIPNTLDTSIAKRVDGLSDYIHDPKRTRGEYLSDYISQLHSSVNDELISEKCVYSNSRNFLDDDPYYQKIEMSQTASLNSQVIDPIVHIVGSFKKFEVPTTQQLEEQIDILTRHLGAEELQIQYAMHLDTDNVHFHLIVNKVHPFQKNKRNENKVIDLGDGWILNAVHRAAAEIEVKQGWQPEPNPLFVYNHVNEKCERNPNYNAKPDAHQIDSKVRDQEHRHQQKSQMRNEISAAHNYQSYLAQDIEHIFNSTKNWKDWHQQLAQVGILYEKKRNGSIFKIQTSEKQILTFKASLFCNRQVTLKNLEKKWGEFIHHDINQIRIPLIKLSDTAQQNETVTSKLHAYHLFNNDDFLIKDLHDSYLTMKLNKDLISLDRKNKYKEIEFDNEIYKYNKGHFLKRWQQKFPAQSSDVIFTLLHYHHLADQKKSRAQIREKFSSQHKDLSKQTSEKLPNNIFSSRNFDSSKITSYANFLKYISPMNPLLIQQQFLFDQRQSKNFITQNNPNIRKAQLLFDQQQPDEPIAIQNRYGILVFSNYSLNRLRQCINALDPKQKARIRGTVEFKELFRLALEHKSRNIQDINKERVLPSFKNSAPQHIQTSFKELYKYFTATDVCQSTALIKTALLLNCCSINVNTLQSTLADCVRKNDIPDLSIENQKILMQRIHNLVYTQSLKLNKQYFNANEIEQCWQLYFSLQLTPLVHQNEREADKSKILPEINYELSLVPKNQINSSYQHTEYLSKPDLVQLHDFFEYSQKSKRMKQNDLKPINSFKAADNSSSLNQQTQKRLFPSKKYLVEYKFGHKFYLDQKKVAFFEDKNSSEINVLSKNDTHIHDALLLARDKFGVVLVSGTDEFKQKVQQLATLEDIQIEFDSPPKQVPYSPIDSTKVENDQIEYKRSDQNSPYKELALEPKELSQTNQAEKATHFYENQSVSPPTQKKDSQPENRSYDGPDF